MDKTKLINKIAVATFTASLLFSSMAFGNQVEPVPIMPISQTSINESIVKEHKANYRLFEGTISDIQKNDSYISIKVSNEQDTIVFNLWEDILIIDQKTKELKTVEDLQEDTQVSVVLDKVAPMTMSLPPITNGGKVIVINDDSSFINVSYFNEELTNEENTLKLNINEDTPLMNLAGEKFSQEELKNKDLLCFYTVTTRSIPAQTSPELVVLLAEEKNDKVELSASKQDLEEMVSVRDMARDYGYSVEWISGTKTVILKKEAHSISLTIGSNNYGNNKSIVKLTKAPELRDGKTYVPMAIAELLLD